MNQPPELPWILEAALLASEQPLTIEQLASLFPEAQRPSRKKLEQALAIVADTCRHRSVELKQVASGYRLQIKQAFTPWLQRLRAERPPRYTRALLETVALIAYRQPVTRGDIEAIRGVSVSSHMMRLLQEKAWVRVVGHRDAPGRPALLATTKQFLDDFNLASLRELPPLPGPHGLAPANPADFAQSANGANPISQAEGDA